MSYLLALDQGTSSSRSIVFNREGRVVASAQRELRQIYPQPGWVEHDPLEIWASQLATAKEALQRAGIDAAQVKAIGITNQRETTVLWNRRTGVPLHNAIVWQDRRTEPLCQRLRDMGQAANIQARTGLVVDAYFSATKIGWILDHVPDARTAAECGELAFGTIDTWLLWNLTGGAVHATDVSNASRTQLLNIHTGDWDDDLLKLFRIPRALLPKVRASSGIFGDAVALGGRIPVAGIAGDQQAALFGQACLKPGMVKNTYGTGCFMLMNTGTKPVLSGHQLLTTIAWKIGNHTEYALEGSVFIGGAVVQWLRDGLGIIRNAAEVENLAAQVPDNGGVYLVPAFSGLGAPHWDPYARGLIIGLTRGSSRAHIARAALESVALQVADLIAAMQSDSGIKIKELRVDGGASRNDLLMQMQADILGCAVVRSGVTETTALGAAGLAGLAVGVWEDQRGLQEQWSEERRFTPQMKPAARKKLRIEWDAATARAAGWAK